MARPWGWGGSAPQAQFFFAGRRKNWDFNPSSSHLRAPKGRISWWLGGYGGQELGGITGFPASAGGGWSRVNEFPQLYVWSQQVP